MAIAVTDIGTVASGAGATAVVTVGAAGVPAGATIVVSVFDTSNAAPGGSVTDTAGNTYTAIAGVSLNNTQASGFVRMFYAFNIAALVNTNTITYTKAVSGSNVAADAIYITGLTTGDPLDSATKATGFGNSASPTVTSGTPGVSGEIFIGWAARTTTQAFTQASGWAAPPNAPGTSTIGGNQLNAGSGTLTYNPALAGTTTWAVVIASFKPPGSPRSPGAFFDQPTLKRQPDSGFGFAPATLSTILLPSYNPTQPFERVDVRRNPDPGFGFAPATLVTELPIRYKPTALFDPPVKPPPVAPAWAFTMTPIAANRGPILFPQFDQPRPPWPAQPAWAFTIPPRLLVSYIPTQPFDQPSKLPVQPAWTFTMLPVPTNRGPLMFPTFDPQPKRFPVTDWWSLTGAFTTLIPVPIRATLQKGDYPKWRFLG